MGRPRGISRGVLYFDTGLTQQCVEELQELGMEKLGERVQVFWNTRMRSTAGRAFYLESKIELNPLLKQVPGMEVQGTLLHELAHLIAHARAGKRRIAPHGVEWRQACTDLGIPNAAVTHELPLPSRRMARKWHYSCPHCDEVITRARRMKRRWVACYSCCRKHSGGKYDKRFQLQESYIEE